MFSYFGFEMTGGSKVIHYYSESSFNRFSFHAFQKLNLCLVPAVTYFKVKNTEIFPGPFIYFVYFHTFQKFNLNYIII
jgi:hypothetical protein